MAYTAHVPLSYDELTAMPALYWAFRAHSLWVYEEHYRKGSARTDRRAMADLPQLEWWASHHRQLGSILVEAGRAVERGSTFMQR